MFLKCITYLKGIYDLLIFKISILKKLKYANFIKKYFKQIKKNKYIPYYSFTQLFQYN